MSEDPNVTDILRRNNTAVFFDVTVADTPIGRIKLELYSSKLPKTCENFRQFCTGEFTKSAQPIGYKGSKFHRVIKGFMIQGGDFLKGDGTGKTSIYNEIPFADEDLTGLHNGAGILSMANSGPDSNGCQFFLTCGAADWLDGKHCVFGKVIDQDSMLVIRKIEACSVGVDNRPKHDIKISECGEL
ncbi:hypothetical protein TrLO_g5611 [Triparma laevis f. longispina]|uniref:Peptidyl-prolyl cis-trans isomerase n=2 Tax=Triparma laevis TaxID=1534972 RepID=A0A9W7CJT5_9STRA|nr:hypothetical protein TrLO_g5611 [Triparma laevis f. longispina]